ncbi:Mercuric transport protein, MerT [hydrothermal vent metagenome]|uniref:Mercuric transport protein, MerT n=1 Tax=hydrothermal vent metagenome TaxID=652676 RepID=A0A3B1D0P3_9ZZZZ
MKENSHGIAGDAPSPAARIETTEGVRKVKRRFTSFGPMAIIAALLASVCCVGPFVLVMLGVSGAWIGNLTAFEPYKPVFILFTIGFLVAGFYSVYRKPKEECEPGSLCANPRTKKVQKAGLWIATAVVAFLLVLPYLIVLLA